MILFKIVQIFANSKLWAESISASGIVCTCTLSVFLSGQNGSPLLRYYLIFYLFFIERQCQ
jgi:hypothetical protein